MKNQNKAKRRAEIKRLIYYTVTGGAWFWSGYAMFAICDKVFGLDLWWSKLIANVFGISINFILERIWVFADTRTHKRLTVVTERYIIITLINFVIDYLIVWSLKSVGVTPYIGQFVSAGFFYAWNYLWYKFWVFAAIRKHKEAHV